jgi:hypothetical protein
MITRQSCAAFCIRTVAEGHDQPARREQRTLELHHDPEPASVCRGVHLESGCTESKFAQRPALDSDVMMPDSHPAKRVKSSQESELRLMWPQCYLWALCCELVAVPASPPLSCCMRRRASQRGHVRWISWVFDLQVNDPE